jgi:hypothetical protein
MVYNPAYGYNAKDNEDNALVHDLRQVYANQILGETLKAVMIARMNEKYVLWFNLLKNSLRTSISVKLTPKEIKKLDIKIGKTKEILYNLGETYRGAVKEDEVENDIIEEALCKLETRMLRLMEKHNMFGNKEDTSGL